MVIDINPTTKLTLQIGTGRVTAITGGERNPVVFADQLRALLKPRGDAGMQWLLEVHDACVIALDRDSKVGVKATRHNRDNWQRSLRLIDSALALEARKEAA